MIDSKKAFAMIKSGEIEFVDLKFTDLRGTWQHTGMPAHQFTAESCKKGYGFDGSSIRGFQSIYESDMLLKPDLDAMFVDPFHESTLSVICEVFDPVKGEFFEKDPRVTAKKAEKYLKDSKVADISYWGPELEFFLFESMGVSLTPYKSGFYMENEEIPNQGYGEEYGMSYKINQKSGYFPVSPFDKQQAFRAEMVKILEQLGITVESHHHEVATGGQVEIDLQYDSLVSMADKVMLYKYVARNLAQEYGLTAIFLPKPVYGDNGSGMHTHQSLFKGGKNLFYDKKGYGQLSDTALSYIAGLLSNIEGVLGFTNPTLNSYRRLVPHFEAPTGVAFSARNRSAAVRIPMYFQDDEKAKRLEFRCPDPTTNPYLSFSAQLVSGVNGIKSKLDPKKMKFGPYDEDIWEDTKVKQTPRDLFTSLSALEKSNVFTDSGVFAKAMIDSYLEVKRDEATQSLMYPTPADFFYTGDL
jgi:glutamine synthetase